MKKFSICFLIFMMAIAATSELEAQEFDICEELPVNSIIFTSNQQVLFVDTNFEVVFRHNALFPAGNAISPSGQIAYVNNEGQLILRQTNGEETVVSEERFNIVKFVGEKLYFTIQPTFKRDLSGNVVLDSEGQPILNGDAKLLKYDGDIEEIYESDSIENFFVIEEEVYVVSNNFVVQNGMMAEIMHHQIYWSSLDSNDQFSMDSDLLRNVISLNITRNGDIYVSTIENNYIIDTINNTVSTVNLRVYSTFQNWHIYKLGENYFLTDGTKSCFLPNHFSSIASWRFGSE